MKTIILSAALVAGFALSADAQGRGPGPDFATLDRDGDGRITLEELEGQAEARFAAADANGDGGLSAEEMAAAMQARMGERAARMLERLDTDGDGLLQPAEMRPRGGEGMERMFGHLDADGDGAISAAEFDDRPMRHGRSGKRN